MLPYKNRLLKEKDFEKVFKNGKGFKQDFLYLKLLENELPETRFGIVISKKVCKKAVTRNKIKRRIRHLIKQTLPDIKKGKDVILIVLKDKEITSLDDLFKKSGLL